MRLLFLYSLIVLTTSCLKNKDDFDNGPKAEVAVLNYVVNDASFGVSFDNSSLITSPLSFGTGTGTSTDPYLKLAAGTHTIVMTSGTNTVIDNVFSLSANTKYSVFLYDTLKAVSVKILLFKDVFTAVDTMAKGRFLQFIPKDSLTLSIIKNNVIPIAGDTLISSDIYIGRKSITDSVGFPFLFKPGSYRIKLSRGSTILLEQPTVTISAGKVYSFISRGIIGATGVYKESLDMILHN